MSLDRSRISTLQWACDEESLQVTRALLRETLGLSKPMERTVSAAAIVREMLRHPSIDVNFMSTDGGQGETSALQLSCMHGDFETVSMLLEHKDMDINASAGHYHEEDGCLEVAVIRGHLDVVELLLQQASLALWQFRSTTSRFGAIIRSNPRFAHMRPTVDLIDRRLKMGTRTSVINAHFKHNTCKGPPNPRKRAPASRREGPTVGNSHRKGKVTAAAGSIVGDSSSPQVRTVRSKAAEVEPTRTKGKKRVRSD
jgi:metal-responsive CopG/Arc/MetJ family transcriptional regulator